MGTILRVMSYLKALVLMTSHNPKLGVNVQMMYFRDIHKALYTVNVNDVKLTTPLHT